MKLFKKLDSQTILFYILGETCIEEDINYWGSDINLGLNDRKPSVESCISFCQSSYPQAPYFVWVGPSRNWAPKSCWCKQAGALDNRREAIGIFSGKVDCQGKTWKRNVSRAVIVVFAPLM